MARCRYCGSTRTHRVERLVKRDLYGKSLGVVALYKCESCGKTFSADVWLRLRPKNLKVYYFSYPYGADPVKMSERVKNKVQAICRVRKDIVPFVPHYAFDALFGFPAGLSMPEVAAWEVLIISMCDGFVYEPNAMSSGVIWEKGIAECLDKPILTYDQVLKGEDRK